MVMNKKIISALLIFYFSFSAINAFAQFKYWILLKDKTGTPYTITNPSAFLTTQSILRRSNYNIAINASDLPVTPSYITQIASVPNVKVLYASKWLNGVVVSVPDRTLAVAALSTIKTFSFVVDTSRVKKYHVNINEPVNINPQADLSFARTSTTTSSGYKYGGSYWQNQQLNVICMHEQGYRGQGMTIAVLDAGFSSVDTGPMFDSLRNDGRILGTRDFVSGMANAYYGATHGTEVLSCMAANIPGRILGSAPLAKYWLLRTEDGPTETISEEYNWIRGAEFADSVGVDILTTSLGYTDFDDPAQNHTYSTLTGRKAPMSIAANMAARKGLFVLNAAGNEGQSSWHYIGVPADADSICTVGAIDTLNSVGAFSSVGPTFDKRIKPELVAMGVNSWISDGVSTGFPGSGTSFATPILAGAVACFWQAHRSYNNMGVLDALKKSADNHCSPNNSRGWGLPKMCPALLTVKSNAKLDGRYNHAGIKVKFIAVSGNARTDSVFTNMDGSYSINLNPGAYNITFSKPNYKSIFYMGNSLVNIDLCNNNNPEVVNLVIDPEAPEIQFDFTAFADPSNSQMTILLSDAGYEYINIEVYNIAGRTLLSSEVDVESTTVVLDATNFSDAIYLVKVKTSKGTKTKKVLKR